MTRRPPSPSVTVAPHTGVPTLHVDGVPNAGMTYMTYSPTPKHFARFGEAGVDFASLLVAANHYPLHTKSVWLDDDRFDFSEMDRVLGMIHRANPKALIFPRVFLFSPPWWNERNPRELMRYHDGSTRKPMEYFVRDQEMPSWASARWRKDTAHCLRRMIEHIQSQLYGPQVIGYHLASGGTDEWYYYPNYEWFYFDKPQSYFLDYGPRQTQAFRRWLKAKYGSDSALRRAWHARAAKLTTARIAPPEDKLQPDLGQFFDPRTSQHVIDTFDFESEMVADTIGYFCRVVKDATDGRAITGAFYGYLTGAVDKVYCATRSLLQCPDIDFFTSPSAYQFREPGSGCSTFRGPVASVQLHGKLWWDENDYRTDLVTERRGSGLLASCTSFEDTESLQLRQLAAQITHGAAGWWFDMRGGWFDSPRHLEMVRTLNDIGERSVHVDRSSGAEIAVVVDEKSLCCIGLDSKLYRPLIMDQRLELCRTGAPVDWILMDDLDDAPEYRMYVFLNAFRVTDSQRRAVRRLRKHGARALVWVYAPGLVGDTLDVRGCRSVTGMELGMLDGGGPLQVEVDSAAGKLLEGARAGTRYGTRNIISPILVGNDPSATTLGTLFGHDAPGLITKTDGACRSYFSSAPTLPSSLLRAIAAKAGVHIYSDSDDSWYINNSFIGVHACRSGRKALRFPEPTALYDPYHRRTVASRARKATIQMQARETVVLFRATEDEWRGGESGPQTAG